MEEIFNINTMEYVVYKKIQFNLINCSSDKKIILV